MGNTLTDQSPPTVLSYSAQPADTTILCERIEGGLAFTDPPSREIIGIIGFVVLMVVLTCAWIALSFRLGTFALLVGVWIGVAWLIRTPLHIGRIPTTLSVTREQIVLIRPGPIAIQRRVWRTSDATSIVSVPRGSSLVLRPV